MATPDRPTLTALADAFRSDKGTKARLPHKYTYLYDLMFRPLRDREITLLELGLAIGGPETVRGRIERRANSPSVAMWLDYFPKARIYGFDISDFSHIRHDRFAFIRGDAGAEADLDRLVAALPPLDIVLDDASHASFHQQYCLKRLFPLLKPGGLYVVEDLHWQSPVYEAQMPAVPLTAALFADFFERGTHRPGAVFTEAELRALADEVETFAIFPDFSGQTTVPKLLVLRRKGGEEAAPPPARPAAADAPARIGPEPAPAAPEPAPEPAAPVVARRRVRSFDLFDTLIARRCGPPANVFRIMEARLGRPGFARERMLAERGLARGAYTLADIHAALVAARPEFGLDPEATMRIELEVERENLFPIAAHVAEVAPGDLVVSDMYLPAGFLEQVLREVCGLHANPLILSAHGKRSRAVWPALQAQFEIASHLGDNAETDGRSPEAAGIASRLTGIAAETPTEREVASLGFPAVALAMREARLRLSDPDPSIRALLAAQAEANAPMLLFAAAAALRLAAGQGARRLLASSRDCFLWLRLLRGLAPRLAPGLRAEYFLTSRIARAFPSAGYAAYLRDLCGEGPAVILDVCGTGWSLQRLLEQTATRAEILFIHRIEGRLRAAYEAMGGTTEAQPVRALASGQRPGQNSVLLELLNPAPHPMVLDVVEVGAAFAPVFAEPAEAAAAVALRAAMRRGFDMAASCLLDAACIEEVAAAPAERVAEAMEGLYAGFGRFSAALQPLAMAHRAEDAAVRARLAALGRGGQSAITAG